jgi:hypothetical protein
VLYMHDCFTILEKCLYTQRIHFIQSGRKVYYVTEKTPDFLIHCRKMPVNISTKVQ